jgi:hypothetical protein
MTLLAAAVLLSTAAGCNCWKWCQSATTACAPGCAAQPCNPAGDPYLTAPGTTVAPGTIQAGPETYTPSPNQ